MSDIRLVVQGDDFGMCHAVNEGIERAFTEGILTQTSAMAPCPWFDEAAEVAVRLDIPTGVHLTLTCEWDHLRWPPLSGRPSLYADDRTMHRTVPEARAAITVEDATEECRSQTARVVGAGIHPTHLDMHMGVVHAEAYSTVCRERSVPFIHPVVDEAYPFDSVGIVVGASVLGAAGPTGERFRLDGSGAPDGTAAGGSTVPAWMREYLARLTPGTHALVTHPAEPGRELVAITGPTSPVAEWAQPYRASDLATLVDPAVRDAIAERGIALTSVRDLQAGPQGA